MARPPDRIGDPEFDPFRFDATAPDDLATIIYTSGTTGAPKGVMLTHGNMASNISSSMEGFGFGTKEEVSLSFLPLSHVTARHVDFALLYRGVVLAYCPDIAHLARALAEVRPNIFIAVPRVYEKIRQQVILKTVGFPKSAIYRWALSAGRAHRNEIMAGIPPAAISLKMKIADRLVFSKVRAGMGGEAEEFISGGAPLGRELAEWYADIGIPIHEGYGLTETSPVIAVNTPKCTSSAPSASLCRTSKCGSPMTAKCWYAGRRSSRAIGIVPKKPARHSWMAGLKPETLAMLMTRAIFRSPIARKI